MCANSSTEAGFTLIEMIVIVVILGILAVVAMPRMNASDHRGAQFRDQVVAALRHAQKTATSHRRLVCVSFPDTTSLSLQIADASGASSCNTNLLLPGSGSNTVTSPDSNVAFTALPTAFNFQPDGSGADRSITISGQTAITVVGATGHVQ